MSIKSAARNFGMLDVILRNMLRYQQERKEMLPSGRKPALMEEPEKDLAECICVFVVEDYVIANELKTPLKNGRPGKDLF